MDDIDLTLEQLDQLDQLKQENACFLSPDDIFSLWLDTIDDIATRIDTVK